MTEIETAKLVKATMALYPNWHPDIEDTVMAWHIVLAEDSYDVLELALVRYARTDKSGFAPSIGALLDNVQSFGEPERSEQEVVAMVRKAICKGNYYATEEFEKLPSEVQKAVGSPANLQEWAQLTTKEVETVILSQVLNSYRGVIKRVQEDRLLPNSLKGIGKTALGESQRLMLEG